jgi:hypothetical protein
MLGRPALLGIQSDQSPLGLIMTGLGVGLSLLGALN